MVFYKTLFINNVFFRIICPDELDTDWTTSLWNIMFKVRVEAMMWGAGTALGELPPYFMARAARLSGRPPDEDKEDLIEFEELLKKEKHPETMVTVLLLFDFAKLFENYNLFFRLWLINLNYLSSDL